MTKPVINVTPLIDVLLVLLIIFMVVTPMKPAAFKAKIPKMPAKNDIVSVHPDTLVVIVSEDRSLGINHEKSVGTVDDPQKTIRRLAEIFSMRRQSYIAAAMDEANAPQTVFIKAPRGLNYGSVAKVVDAVKASGADPISLQIDGL
ncbi:MAG: biopolymer transporter ExbD [Saprospiraceae bacterium]|nr:biopolymer transporter ExbD [Pyrinomonadaceae bacterium]